MSSVYTHDHRRNNVKASVFLVVLLSSLAGLGLIAFFIYNDLQTNKAESVQGEERTVSQAFGSTTTHFVTEEDFEFELPGDWREIDKIDRPSEQSITWQATKKNADNRWLKLYINTIPDDPIVRLLPVTVEENKLKRGQLSAPCGTFTGSDADGASVIAKWEDVEFMCDLTKGVDNNIIGTGQKGQPLNTLTVTGEKSGKNRYFFVYTDRNIQPKYEIIYDAINSFQAK